MFCIFDNEIAYILKTNGQNLSRFYMVMYINWFHKRAYLTLTFDLEQS